MKEAPAGGLDLIFVDSTDPIGPGEVLFSRDFYAACFAALGEGGIIVQQSESPLLHMDILKRMVVDMGGAGFSDTRTLSFPQPTYPSGLWSATMARKGLPFDGFRDEAASNPPFATHYYTVATHRGALALPPFVARQLADV
jgi:spermidine synthase